MFENYKPLTEEDAVQYAHSKKEWFAPGAEMDCREIGDGNLNLVFRIADRSSGRSLIFKQALPYARVVGESWPLTLERSRIEAEALKLAARRVPDLVPRVYFYDDQLALTVMEDLSDHIILRKGLIKGEVYPRLAEDLAEYLAQTLFFTSEYYLDAREKKEKVRRFINPEMCKITEDLVFTDPYYDAETNSFNSLIRETVEAIWNDARLKKEIAHLKESFMTRAQALLHGDLHTGSVMVKKDSTKVIDPEFAYYGPIGFDVGAVIANLFLSFVSHEAHTRDRKQRETYQNWLLETAEKIWSGFEQTFRALWKEHVKDEMWCVPGYVDDVLYQVLQDAAGFAGCKMMRRVIGLAPVADLESIEDTAVRAEAETRALEIGRQLVLQRHLVHSAADLIRIAREAGEGLTVK
ncbi:S-methyl-5-thioribose kinase [Thermoactinomyces intermedius]|uniref:Methylthioribose kinase n=1 Tax=Thermoactinomyces intermedius TaxID=2024 RepID=A0A8I1AH26_THEIN|nr:S-methyl-5-thioribose kinase [Thermoactinomyces intermedius]MBA4549134.1 S-methyl-5-thioribose kinase [Thermoactinomyces intermedius]MBA4837367.1 S-methyl-5-thioribose kinase [Thermoactinomyces intermedius]MBH8595848.1 S-methyl-5-thioribose kinase [Thermoactinomyces intermedius]